MIEVLFENNYNRLQQAAEAFGGNIMPGSEGMIMYDGGEAAGAAVWTRTASEADVYFICAPDGRGAYFDLLVRSAVSCLMDMAARICISDAHDYYLQLGFRYDGGRMTALSGEIKFPKSCGKGE